MSERLKEVKTLIEGIKTKLGDEGLKPIADDVFKLNSIIKVVEDESKQMVVDLATAKREAAESRVGKKELQTNFEELQSENAKLKDDSKFKELKAEHDKLKEKHSKQVKELGANVKARADKLKEDEKFKKAIESGFIRLPEDGKEWDEDIIEYNIQGFNKLDSLGYFGELSTKDGPNQNKSIKSGLIPFEERIRAAKTVAERDAIARELSKELTKE